MVEAELSFTESLQDIMQVSTPSCLHRTSARAASSSLSCVSGPQLRSWLLSPCVEVAKTLPKDQGLLSRSEATEGI